MINQKSLLNFRGLSNNSDLPEVLVKLKNDIEQSADSYTADALFHDHPQLEKINDTLYKYGEYRVQLGFEGYYHQYPDKMKKLEENNISIAPKLADVARNGTSMYMFFKLPGTSSGELIPYHRGKHLLSDEAKQEAFNDLKKLTKLGYVNQKMLRNAQLWTITPEAPHKILVPEWNSLRDIENEEREEVLSHYQKLLFGR